MNRQPISLLKSASALIALILAVSCNVWPQEGSNVMINTNVMNKDGQRESITFILGEDKDTKNPYYTEAFKYYKNNPAAKTTYMETKCRSLQEVKNYLSINAPTNNQPWGMIHLVSHGDQWLGLSVKLKPDSKRATMERIREYNHLTSNIPLPDSIIDRQSQIIIHACGVGNNPELIENLGLFFKSKSSVPGIKAPLLFEFYSTEINNKGQAESLEYQTQSWMVAYKNNDRPGDIQICNLFHEKYPNAKTDWQDALKREHPRSGGDIYHYTFDVPIIMTVNALENDSISETSTPEKKTRWISRQPEIIKALNSINLPMENFRWNLKNGYISSKNGKRTPVIIIKGYCTILCVLKPLLNDMHTSLAANGPFIPAGNDSHYYLEIKGRYCLNN